MAKLILLRHGQSEWNRLNLFTGWVDVPLSVKGVEESIAAGKALASIPIDVIFTSTLIRAQETVALAMMSHGSGKVPRFVHEEKWFELCSEKTKQQTIPVYAAEELNERMYGELQGLNKQETIEKFGKEQVHRWRRSFDQAPPGGESLKMTAARSIPYFQKKILPLLTQGKNVLIAAHGNSLRAISMVLDGLSEELVMQLEIPTGEPILYTHSTKGWEKDG
jgi:2,3-bisphosphoglycerate-dependent phosphoglycerate mutase